MTNMKLVISFHKRSYFGVGVHVHSVERWVGLEAGLLNKHALCWTVESLLGYSTYPLWVLGVAASLPNHSKLFSD
jgi:hypothetical protein